MFYNKYLDDYYLNELYENYDINYLRSINEDNFYSIYTLFENYGFYYIEDIIENYLDIFTLDKSFVEKKILQLKEKLGDNYISIIGEDMDYLNDILE